MLDELQLNGLIFRYEAAGQRCIFIPTIIKHQNPHPKEQASELPEFSEEMESRLITRQAVEKHEEQQTSNAFPSLPSLPSSPSSSLTTRVAAGSVEVVNGAFEDFWSAYPNKVGKPAALRAFLRAKPSQAALLDGLARWKRCDQWTKDKGRFIPHPSTFLNQRRWEDAPDSAAPPKTQIEIDNDKFWDAINDTNQQKQIA